MRKLSIGHRPPTFKIGSTTKFKVTFPPLTRRNRSRPRTSRSRSPSPEIIQCSVQTDPAISRTMPVLCLKLGATATKTVQPKFAHVLDFRGFRRVLLVRVCPEIALMTRSSCPIRRRFGPRRKTKIRQESSIPSPYHSEAWERVGQIAWHVLGLLAFCSKKPFLGPFMVQ
jgi:hypothetical protein